METDEAAVFAGVPAGGRAVATRRCADTERARGRARVFRADAAWTRRYQDEADRGERPGVLTTDERARLRELERENRVLRQEREILKRAAAFFIRESDRP